MPFRDLVLLVGADGPLSYQIPFECLLRFRDGQSWERLLKVVRVHVRFMQELILIVLGRRSAPCELVETPVDLAASHWQLTELQHFHDLNFKRVKLMVKKYKQRSDC